MSPTPEHRPTEPDDDTLVLLADAAVAAIRGDQPPADADPKVVRRVQAVIEAIRDARGERA